MFDYDFVIVGSGFGGSVAALRLREKGYSVAVLEQGRRIDSAEIEAAARNPLKLFWFPALGLKGFFNQTVLRHVGIVSGVGVGGGSLVYAAVLLEPREAFFTDPAWRNLGPAWQAELAPHYATARRMLGCAPNPYFARQDEHLRGTAARMGSAETVDTVPLGIYYGTPGQLAADPYFDGRGPARTGCRLCGACLTGCPHNAKNSLDKNYLYLATQLGADVLAERQVTLLRPLADGGYLVESRHPFTRRRYPPLRAREVVLAAGVLGTLKLLFRCREAGTLPHLSPQLGRRVRTNSEAIVAVLADSAPPDGAPTEDLSQGGPSITSHFYPNDHTHITQNRFGRGYQFMRWYMGPLVDGAVPWRRALRTLAQYVRHPLRATASWRGRDWHQRVTVLSVMQHVDNKLALRYGRTLFTGWRRGVQSQLEEGARAPTFLPEANAAARAYAAEAGGTPLNVWLESVGNLSITAHILGGCPMGASAESGVIDTAHRVFNYPGLYVVDGSALSANVGVNPSLTITALAERAMGLIRPKAA